MEGDAAISVMYMEYVDSSATVEGCGTTSPLESLVQESNVDLLMNVSPTSQHRASELPTARPKHRSLSRLTHTKWNLRPKLRSLSKLVHRNWRTGLEVGILTGIILMVWVLFSIPTILYLLPPQIKEVATMHVNVLSN